MPSPVFLTDAYEMIISYQNTSDPTLKWRNTWEIFSTSAPLPTDPLVSNLILLGLAFADASVTLETISCYAWARGTVPYPEGSALWVKTVGSACTAGSDWGTVRASYIAGDKSLCLRIDKEPFGSGRPGRNFIRGLIGTSDVSAIAGGRWQLDHTPASWNTALAVILTDANIPQYFSGGASSIKLIIVRYSAKTNTVHGYAEVTGLNIIGATTAKGNRKSAR
jgi:hypothetical protein